MIFGRLAADFVHGLGAAFPVLMIALVFGARIHAGVLGVVVLVPMSASFGTAYGGRAVLVALKIRSVQTTSASFIVPPRCCSSRPTSFRPTG
jgi:hypothetical protein